MKKRIIDVAAEAVKCFERDDQKVAKKVAADEMKTKVVTKKMDSDKRKQKKSTKKELVKAESTEVAPNRVVHEKCAEEKVGKKASPTLVKKDKIGSAEKINTGKVNVEPKNICEVDAKPVPGVGSPPEGEARLPAPLTEEELLSVCWRWTVGLRTYLENLANFLASFQDIRMEEGNLLTFEFPFRGLLERTLAALATEETGSVAKLRQGKQQVRLGLAADCLPRWCWSRSGLRTQVRPGAARGARPRARGARGGRAGGGPRLVGLQAGLHQGAHRHRATRPSPSSAGSPLRSGDSLSPPSTTPAPQVDHLAKKPRDGERCLREIQSILQETDISPFEVCRAANTICRTKATSHQAQDHEVRPATNTICPATNTICQATKYHLSGHQYDLSDCKYHVWPQIPFVGLQIPFVRAQI